jgi:hypothetical protein
MQIGKGAEITACSPLQLRPLAGRLLALYAVLGFAGRTGYKMADFRCKISSSYSQSRGRNWVSKFRLPFLPVVMSLMCKVVHETVGHICPFLMCIISLKEIYDEVCMRLIRFDMVDFVHVLT